MTTTAGLTRNTDFSADLLLNKVMSGQYRTNNGKTITLAGRLNASNLDSTARSMQIEAENVNKGVVTAKGMADALAEMTDIVKKARDAATSVTDAAELTKIGNSLKSAFDNIAKTKINGNDVFETPYVQKMGLGDSTGISIGLSTFRSAGDGKGISDALGSLSSTTDLSSFEKSLTALQAQASNTAATLENRYNMLNDLTQSYEIASNDQVVNASGNSTSLVNTLLS